MPLASFEVDVDLSSKAASIEEGNVDDELKRAEDEELS